MKHDSPKLDGELKRQLDAARETNTPVEAVLMLRDAEDPATNVLERATGALRRVEASVGTAPDVVNILSNLGVVVVSAAESFVRELVDQPEFASAVANSDVEPVSDEVTRGVDEARP